MALGLTFAFDPQKGETTETLTKRRRVAEALLARAAGQAPRNVGEGLSALGNALAYRFAMNGIDKAEKAGKESADSSMNRVARALFGGPESFPDAPSRDRVADAIIGRGKKAEAEVDTSLGGNAGAEALSAYLTPDKDKSHLQFDNDFGGRLQKFLADAPDGGINIYSGYRSPERQAELFANAVKKYGSEQAARKWVAPPGKSNHNHGTAADLRYASDAQKKWAHENAAKYGLTFRMGHEPWHIEPLANWDGGRQQSASAGPAPGPVASPNPDGRLPAGMRNYNPGNLKYRADVPWEGLLGPSQNTDQGDPQAVFESPEMGMRATAKLALNKYGDGMRTANQMIAGEGGWTPGNTRAAANIAASMGIGADDDLNLNDPAMAQKFLRALVLQEHGPASGGYSDDLIAKGLDLARGGTQVASLDPSVGLPPAQEQPQQTAGLFLGTPDEMAAQRQRRVSPQMLDPRAMGPQNGFVPPQRGQEPPQTVRAPSAGNPANQPGPMRMADASQMSDADALAAFGAQPYDANTERMQAIMAAYRNGFLGEQDRSLVNTLMQRELDAQDPYKRVQLEKAQLDLDAARSGQWAKLDDGRLYNQRTGEVRDAPASPGGGQMDMFDGKSVEAQGLNYLVRTNRLTREQAAQLAAGKQITDPSTGAIMFMTPEGIFGQQGNQPPQPILPQGGGSSLLSPQALGDAGQMQPPAQQPPASQPSSGRPGAIPLTPPKAEKVPDATRNATAKVNQAFDTIGSELDRYSELVGQHGVEMMPGEAKDNLNSVRQGIMLQMKELFNLGVLNGPDLSLMERMIYDPVVDPLKEGGIANLPGQMWDSVTGNAGSRAQNSVVELKRMLTNIKDATNRAAAGTVGGSTASPAAGGASSMKSKYGLD